MVWVQHPSDEMGTDLYELRSVSVQLLPFTNA